MQRYNSIYIFGDISCFCSDKQIMDWIENNYEFAHCGYVFILANIIEKMAMKATKSVEKVEKHIFGIVKCELGKFIVYEAKWQNIISVCYLYRPISMHVWKLFISVLVFFFLFK